ncbi:MAG: class I SAM-dependent methyltransferase, partial [bacterium]|nr:class I SAM-dependent methyltransferase [bacterium]
ENPVRIALARAVAEGIRRVVDIDCDCDISALEYGCGTGLVTLELQSYVGSIKAADSSDGMLTVLEQKLAITGIDNVTPIKLDLESDLLPDERYDLIYSSMTMHHIEDVSGVMRAFHELLKPGGHLCIADLDCEPGDFHPDNTGVHCYGFSRDDMQALFASAGFHDTTSDIVYTVVKKNNAGEERRFPVLLTCGNGGIGRD